MPVDLLFIEFLYYSWHFYVSALHTIRWNINLSTSIALYLCCVLLLVHYTSDFCVVISDGPGWGCVSEYGENIMMACYNESFPANMTDVSNSDFCRQVMCLSCRIHVHFVSAFYISTLIVSQHCRTEWAFCFALRNIFVKFQLSHHKWGPMHVGYKNGDILETVHDRKK